jgi:hypothetical protein
MPRINDGKLEHYENIIGASNGIIRRVIYLAEKTDDPEILRTLLEIKTASERIKNQSIAEMQKEKQNE